MRLWLVTFDLDLTQFVVNAETKESAIEEAHQHNMDIGEIDKISFDEITKKNYKAEEIDFNLLCEIFKRNDGMYRLNNSYAFWN